MTAPLDRVSAASFTGWLRGVLTHTGARRSTVVAHSLTGGLAVRAAARDDDLAARLVVYAAPAVGPYRMPVRLRYVAARFAARPTVPNAERRIRFALLDRDATRRRDPGWYDAFSAYITARVAVPSVARTMHQLLGAGTRRVLDTDLARVAVPVSVLWGRHDRMVPLALGATAAAYHGWPLAVVGRAAHAPHIEQPDAFVEALSTLLDPAQPASTVPASGGPIGR